MATGSKKLKAGNDSTIEETAIPTESKKSKSKKLNGFHEKKTNGVHSKEDLFLDELAGNSIDAKELLNILLEVRDGNFDVKMPINKVGISGKVCDALNEIISKNKKLVKEFSRARNTIGKEGKLNQRIVLSDAQGEWKNGVEDLNSLISDLVYPIREIDRVISAVAKGNLSQQIPTLDLSSDHELKGEFACIA